MPCLCQYRTDQLVTIQLCLVQVACRWYPKFLELASPIDNNIVQTLQKVAAGQGGAAMDSRPEHVVSVIERPSQLKLTSPAQHPQSTPVIPPPAPPPPPSLPPSQLPRVPSVATSGVVRRPDINQELVDRIQELYSQIHPTADNAAPTAAV